MRNQNSLAVCIVHRIIALTVIVCLFHDISHAQKRDFIGSNGRVIEAEFLGFDAATQIVKIRLKDGREQNVTLDLFSAACQQWIKSGGKDAGADNPFGDAIGNDDASWGESDWEWLFDGRSLNGWEGDTNAWRVEQNVGALVNTGRGNLFTQKQYDNFILQLEFRSDDRANNGLLLRVDDSARRDVSKTMKIQIADDRNINDGNHNGAIHRTLSGPKPHTFYERNHPTGGWNFLEVIADGQKITTYVNGIKVIDNTIPQDKPFSSVRSGRIGFTGAGGTTAFRYIRIKPLKAGEDGRTSKITANDSREGFVAIFDGRTLNGWQGEQDKFRVENNMLTNFDKGYLATIKEYRNFVMRFEFRLTHGTFSGFNIRKASGTNDHDFNVLIKIVDDFSLKDAERSVIFNGAIDLVHPARRGSLNPVGQWNTMEITANGSMIRVVTNDQIVTDTDIRNFDFYPSGWVGDMIAGLKSKSGHIQLRNTHGQGQVDFRNIRIKELP